MPSELEKKFASMWCEQYPTIDLHSEFMFAKPMKRNFRADFAHIQSKVLIELQGGVFMRGTGHNSIAGVKKDCEKFFIAASLQYIVFTLHTDMVNEDMLTIIADTIKQRCKTSAYNRVMSSMVA